MINGITCSRMQRLTKAAVPGSCLVYREEAQEMKVTGIIAEYNPFHNGHRYHLQQARERTGADVVLAVMSGNFTQRGEPAVLDKWERSRLAVLCGVDLVLELPYVYACSSAEYFAKGGVALLSRLGCVTHLAFGAEESDLSVLQQIAETIEAGEACEKNGVRPKEAAYWKKETEQAMKRGLSYGKAREAALEAVLGTAYSRVVKSPNNILAIEYLKQLIRQEAILKPVLIRRKGAGYYDPQPADGFASATAIRAHLGQAAWDPFMPEPVADALQALREDAAAVRKVSGKNERPHWETVFFDIIRGKILTMEPEELARIFSAGEGLEYKLKKEIRNAESLEEYIALLASRRYPENRIRRLLCHILLGVKGTDRSRMEADGELYARVLAFNRKGAQLLKQIKKQELASVPVVTNSNQYLRRLQESGRENKMLALDLRAADLYNLIQGRDLYRCSDYVRQPFVGTREPQQAG